MSQLLHSARSSSARKNGAAACDRRTRAPVAKPKYAIARRAHGDAWRRSRMLALNSAHLEAAVETHPFRMLAKGSMQSGVTLNGSAVALGGRAGL
eukprot:2581279-Pleurochrysis_carterae.AAC.3